MKTLTRSHRIAHRTPRTNFHLWSVAPTHTRELKVLGVVGARSGSKSIADKNIRSLLGKPLFAWIASAAQQSRLVSRIILSTDSADYAKLGRQFGLEVPFLRPKKFAADNSPDFDYLYHAATWFERHQNWKPDIILRLPPTSPLCRTASIEECINILVDNPDVDSVRTITTAHKHPYKLWRIKDGYLKPFLSEKTTKLRDAHNLPRQSFPSVYQHCDVIALRWRTLVEKKAMAGKKIKYVIIPETEGVDIDNDTDFALAELLLRKRFNPPSSIAPMPSASLEDVFCTP